MKRRILCAIDLGDGTDHVVRMAADQARLTQAELILLFVVDSPLLTLTAGYGSLKLPEDEAGAVERAAVSLRRQAEERLKALAEELEPETIIKVVEGHPVANRITEVLEYEKPDLLVIGSHGRRKIKRLLVGSVCHRLVQSSPVPVLIVKAPLDE